MLLKDLLLGAPSIAWYSWDSGKEAYASYSKEGSTTETCRVRTRLKNFDYGGNPSLGG